MEQQPELSAFILSSELPMDNSNPLDSLLNENKPSVEDTVTAEPQTVVSHVQSSLLNSPLLAGSPLFASFLPTLVELIHKISTELQSTPHALLALNPSRRNALFFYLQALSGQTLIKPHQTEINSKLIQEELKFWVNEPKTEHQKNALMSYFEEVALFTIGQALILKAWSDRGIRKWTIKDLGQLNWALSHALKPHIPIDREGWQLTRPNLYSWYHPSRALQKSIWDELERIDLTQERSQFLALTLTQTRKKLSLEPNGNYDIQFYNALWNEMHHYGFELHKEFKQGAIHRKWLLFTPTIKDGSLDRSCPSTVNCIGLEEQPFQMLVAEMTRLWWGPSIPPLWAIGTGIEVQKSEQLSMAWNTPKPGTLNRLSEIESCDLSVIIEDKPIRSNDKSHRSTHFRALLEKYPQWKKTKEIGTTLGDLQAIISMNKLRPGGYLWWFREQPLNSVDGQPFLKQILEKSKLVCEWDLSHLEQSLPSSENPHPRYIYLFQRELDLEKRSFNHPTLCKVEGKIRSYVEVQNFYSELLNPNRKSNDERSLWKIHSRVSPTPQQEWAENWPNAADESVLSQLESLKEKSTQLGQIGMIRPIPKKENTEEMRKWANSLSQVMPGIRLTAYYDGDSCTLKAVPIHRVDFTTEENNQVVLSDHLLLLPEKDWIPSLCVYLESSLVREWLDHFSEKRKKRWILKDQNLKFIPVPNILVNTLKNPEKIYQDPTWIQVASKVSYQPKVALKELIQGKQSSTLEPEVKMAILMEAANSLEEVFQSQEKLKRMISQDGQVHWKQLMSILPEKEILPFAIHPEVKLSGTMPPHLPITQIRSIKTPTNGVSLSCESGFRIQVSLENHLLHKILVDQMSELTHPTWSELVQFVRLPRRPDFAQATADDLLRSFGEQNRRAQELSDLLIECLKF